MRNMTILFRSCFFLLDEWFLSRLPTLWRPVAIRWFHKVRQAAKQLRFFHVDEEVPHDAFGSDLSVASSSTFRNASVRAVYDRILETLGPEVSHFAVLARLHRGGGPLVTLNIVKAITELDQGAKVAVIAAEVGPSAWLGRLPPEVKAFEFGNETIHLSDEDRQAVLANLFFKYRPSTIYINDLPVCMRTIANYGNLIPKSTRVFLSVFMDYRQGADRRPSEFQLLFERIAPFVAGYISDNETYSKELVSRYRLSSERVHTVYVPTDAAKPSFVSEGRARVLWASRFCFQKRPDILLDVARRCPHVDFDVFGELKKDVDYGALLKILRQLKRLPNVSYFGAFDGIDALLELEHGAFLYTSSFDGVPNVLLEIGARRIPIIAPWVGGIHELIGDGTGWPVKNPSSVEETVVQLDNALTNRHDAAERSERLAALINERHGWCNFKASLEAVPDFI